MNKKIYIQQEMEQDFEMITLLACTIIYFAKNQNHSMVVQMSNDFIILFEKFFPNLEFWLKNPKIFCSKNYHKHINSFYNSISEFHVCKDCLSYLVFYNELEPELMAKIFGPTGVCGKFMILFEKYKDIQ